MSVEVTQFQPPAGTEPGHPADRLLADCVWDARDRRAVFELCGGILETRWYDQLGIPAYGYGPGRLDDSHGPDEYAEETELSDCAAVYALYAHEVLRRA